MFPEIRNSKDLADLPCRHIKEWRWEKRSVLYAGQRKMAGSVCPEHGVRRKEVSARGPKAQGQLCTPLARRWQCEQTVSGERGESKGRRAG